MNHTHTRTHARTDAHTHTHTLFLSHSLSLSRNEHTQEIMPVFKAFVRSRIIIDLRYYRVMNDVETFVQQWCYRDAVCNVVEGELCFDLPWS